MDIILCPSAILGENYKVDKLDFNKLPAMEKFIISRLNETINNVTKNMEKFELGAASSYLYNFDLSRISLKNSFCGMRLICWEGRFSEV